MHRQARVQRRVSRRFRARIGGKEWGREEGLKIARESLTEVRELIQGVQVSAPFGNVRYALEVFEALEGFSARRNETRDVAVGD